MVKRNLVDFLVAIFSYSTSAPLLILSAVFLKKLTLRGEQGRAGRGGTALPTPKKGSDLGRFGRRFASDRRSERSPRRCFFFWDARAEHPPRRRDVESPSSAQGPANLVARLALSCPARPPAHHRHAPPLQPQLDAGVRDRSGSFIPKLVGLLKENHKFRESASRLATCPSTTAARACSPTQAIPIVMQLVIKFPRTARSRACPRRSREPQPQQAQRRSQQRPAASSPRQRTRDALPMKVVRNLSSWTFNNQQDCQDLTAEYLQRPLEPPRHDDPRPRDGDRLPRLRRGPRHPRQPHVPRPLAARRDQEVHGRVQRPGYLSKLPVLGMAQHHVVLEAIIFTGVLARDRDAANARPPAPATPRARRNPGPSAGRSSSCSRAVLEEVWRARATTARSSCSSSSPSSTSKHQTHDEILTTRASSPTSSTASRTRTRPSSTTSTPSSPRHRGARPRRDGQPRRARRPGPPPPPTATTAVARIVEQEGAAHPPCPAPTTRAPRPPTTSGSPNSDRINADVGVLSGGSGESRGATTATAAGTSAPGPRPRPTLGGRPPTARRAARHRRPPRPRRQAAARSQRRRLLGASPGASLPESARAAEAAYLS